MSRPVTLSGVGHAIADEARVMLQQQDRLLSHLHEDRQTMKGTIRIASYSALSAVEIMPLLVKFQSIYADVDFDLTELFLPPPKGFVDAQGQPVDVIIGYGCGEFSGIRGYHTGDMPFIACAAPKYVRRHGKPVVPADCVNHVGVMFSTPSRVQAKTVYHGTEAAEVHWQRTLMFQSFTAAKNAVLLGAGVAVDVPFFHSYQELKEGSLVPVLDGWHYPTHQCFLYVQESSLEYQRIRIFVDWMVEKQRQKLAELKKEFQLMVGLTA